MAMDVSTFGPNALRVNKIWAAREPKLTIRAVYDGDEDPIFHPDDAARRRWQHWSGIPRARDDGIHKEIAETMLSCVEPTPRDMNWTVKCSAFEEMLASKRESVPSPDGLPSSVYRSAGGIGA